MSFSLDNLSTSGWGQMPNACLHVCCMADLWPVMEARTITSSNIWTLKGGGMHEGGWREKGRMDKDFASVHTRGKGVCNPHQMVTVASNEL